MLRLLIYLHILFSENASPAFEEQVIDNNISIGYGIALGDVDGDRRTDILLADKTQIVWYRNGDWKKFVMAENLTELDNVCLAARDLDGDGKVEVAVGAQWNPGETSDTNRSGSVHYLVRPSDPAQKWTPVTLHHEPTVHRMRWIKTSDGKSYLVVLPLHGRGNKGGEGAGVNVIAYEYPTDVHSPWKMHTISREMHLTHNMDFKESPTQLYLAGKEGLRVINEPFSGNTTSRELKGKTFPAGEIRLGNKYIATIEPMHGNKVVVYPKNREAERIVLDSSLNEGHAIGIADFSGDGTEQIVAGWRNPDNQQQVGIRIYRLNGTRWETSWIDKNGMACEDLQIADLNGDGKKDIIASGRSTKNVKIYWNRTK